MEKIIINGYLGGDAKVVSINGEEKFYQVSIAPIRKKSEKEENDRSLLWYQLNMSLSMKSVIPYLKKGTLISVIGNLKISAYLDKNNEAKPACVVYVNNIELLGGGLQSDYQNQQVPPTASNQQWQANQTDQSQTPPDSNVSQYGNAMPPQYPNGGQPVSFDL